MKLQNLFMGKNNPSNTSKEIKASSTELYDKSMYDHLKNKKKIKNGGSSKLLGYTFIALLVLGLLMYSGIFSPDENELNYDQWNLDNNEIPTTSIEITIYASPTCGCCHGFDSYINENGFDSTFIQTESYGDVKDENQIPFEQRACHTSLVGNYFVEGHVPASVILDLLEQQPAIDGITLPGMPAGSPGMSGTKNQAWVFSSILDGEVVGVFQTL